MRFLFFILVFLLLCCDLRSADLPDLLRRAKELSDGGRLEEAYQLLSRFKRENREERDWGLSLLMGNLAWRLGRKEEAISHWREASALAPGEVAPLKNLAKAFSEMGRFEEAARALFKAWELSKDPTLRLYGALALLKAKRAGEALEHLEALRREGRKEKELREGLLEAYLQTAKLKEAEGVLWELLELDPEKVDYWKFLAFLRDKLGDRLGAASALKVAISLQDDPSSRREMVRFYQSLGLWLPAAKLLEASPGDKDYKTLYELYLLGGSPKEALRWAKEALSRTGEEEWLKRVAELQVSLGLYEDAYHTLKDLSHGDPYLWYLLGQCALRTGRFEKAEEAFQKALRDKRYAREAQGALDFLRTIKGP